MPAGDLASTLATSFWNQNSDWVSAILTLAVALTLAFLVDRALGRRWEGRLSREADTRLRFIRRLVYATILLIGIALALSQFTGINKLAASILASGAIVAAIIGFAAQRTLGNFVAGVMIAISQPIRIGDWVTFGDQYGMVEEVRLNFTVLRLLNEARVIIPNEALASGVLRNDTLVEDAVGLSVELWLPLTVDTDAAIRALEAEDGVTVRVADVAAEGVRLGVSGARVPPPERSAREADLRARCLARLRQAGLLT
jgi:small-conductance mechanosensitive channel